MKPHKHAEFIKQWADGAEIQFYSSGGSWVDDPDPSWNCEKMIFRLKPEEKKPVVRWLWVDCAGHITQQFFSIEEIDKKFPIGTMKPLVFSRTEFPE